MKLSQMLRQEAILVDLSTQDKWQAIRRLTEKLVEIGSIPAAFQEDVHAALVAREKSMSTGMEQGIAIPHAAVDGVGELAIALGIFPKGISFDSIDGKPANILVLLVIPRGKKLVHIRTLADVARLLSHETLRQRILACSSTETILSAIREEEAHQPA